MKKFLVSIFTIIFIISMVIVVNAASGSISASPSSNQVTRGNTFTVTVSGSADEDISGLQASLSYDKTKLERVMSGSDLSGANEIAAVVSNQSKSTTIYTLTFKVLDTAELGNTTINITGGTLAVLNNSGEQENVTSLSTSATVKIIDDTTTVDNGKSSSSKSSSSSSKKKNSSKSSSSKSSSSSSKSSSSSSSKKTLPQTGVELVSVIGIAIVSIVAIVSYVSYRKYKNI